MNQPPQPPQVPQTPQVPQGQGPRYANQVGTQFSNDKLQVGWPKQFIVFSGFLLVSVLVIYLGLDLGYETFLEQRVEEKEAELASLAGQVSNSDREAFIAIYSQVSNIEDLLESHVLTTKTFEFLEDETDTDVVYTNFNLDTTKAALTLEGIALSYEDLVSQLALFEDAPEVADFSLKESNLNDANLVVFTIDLQLTPEAISVQEGSR